VLESIMNLAHGPPNAPDQRRRGAPTAEFGS